MYEINRELYRYLYNEAEDLTAVCRIYLAFSWIILAIYYTKVMANKTTR